VAVEPEQMLAHLALRTSLPLADFISKGLWPVGRARGLMSHWGCTGHVGLGISTSHHSNFHWLGRTEPYPTGEHEVCRHLVGPAWLLRSSDTYTRRTSGLSLGSAEVERSKVGKKEDAGRRCR
jgi:hypothetical protein